MKELEKHQMLNVGLVLLFLIAVALACLFRDDGREDYEKGMAAYAAEDWKTAATYFWIAAEKDNPHAQFMLAQCCDNRKGVKTRSSHAEWRSKARNTFQKRAESGDPDAMYYLGVIQINYGNAPVKMRGMDWLEKSASKGNEQAQKLIKSLKRVEELKAAVEDGDPDAMYELAEGYCNGITGIEYTEKAALLFRDAVKNGRADAVRGLQKIASFGNTSSSALFYLGDLAENGNKEAKDTLMNLAEEEGLKGNVYFSLVQMAQKGDMDVLAKFIDMANNGNEDALHILISIAEKGNAKAIDCLRVLAKDNNNEDAARTLLKLAKNGNTDAKEAVHDLEKSKNEDLKSFLGRMKNNP